MPSPRDRYKLRRGENWGEEMASGVDVTFCATDILAQMLSVTCAEKKKNMYIIFLTVMLLCVLACRML